MEEIICAKFDVVVDPVDASFLITPIENPLFQGWEWTEEKWTWGETLCGYKTNHYYDRLIKEQDQKMITEEVLKYKDSNEHVIVYLETSKDGEALAQKFFMDTLAAIKKKEDEQTNVLQEV